MSLEIYVFFPNANVPDRSAWMRSISTLGFPITLDPELDVRAQSGFLPTVYLDRNTGFEFYIGPAAEIVEEYPELEERIGERDAYAEFRWGGYLDECAAAISAAAALTYLTNGIYYNPTDDVIHDAETVVPVTREELREIEESR